MKRIKSILLVSVIFIFVLLLLLNPAHSFQAALKGMSIWWEVLLPALLPFLVIAEMMLGLGVVHFIGTFLDPFMRPLFRVPGTGGFVMAMGFSSGYPMAAKLVSQLRTKKLITQIESERLVAFCTTADPIFLIGAVSVGFFQSPSYAPMIMICHYGAAVVVGLLMRFYGNEQTNNNKQKIHRSKNLIQSAFAAMHQARLENNIRLGLLLKQAITSSLEIIFLLGGLVILISVILELLSVSGVMPYLLQMIKTILLTFHLPETFAKPLSDGIFEVTIGAKAAADDNVDPLYQIVIACFIVSWSGLSVHAQVVGLLSQTDIRYFPFLAARFVHGLLAAILAFFLCRYSML